MGLFSRKPKVLIRVHKGYFANPMELSKEEYYFVNIVNIEKEKSIYIDSVKFKWLGNMVAVLPLERNNFPVKLTSGEQWETWIKVKYIHSTAYNDAYAIVSLEGKVMRYLIRSVRRNDVPPYGTVPGGR